MCFGSLLRIAEETCVSKSSKLVQVSTVLLSSRQEPLEPLGKRPGANCHDRPRHAVAKDQVRWHEEDKKGEHVRASVFSVCPSGLC